MDQHLADVVNVEKTLTGCLWDADSARYRAAVLRPREGLFLAKVPFLKPGPAFFFADSCLLVPVPYNSEWLRVNPDHWWK